MTVDLFGKTSLLNLALRKSLVCKDMLLREMGVQPKNPDFSQREVLSAVSPEAVMEIGKTGEESNTNNNNPNRNQRITIISAKNGVPTICQALERLSPFDG